MRAVPRLARAAQEPRRVARRLRAADRADARRAAARARGRPVGRHPRRSSSERRGRRSPAASSCPATSRRPTRPALYRRALVFVHALAHRGLRHAGPRSDDDRRSGRRRQPRRAARSRGPRRTPRSIPSDADALAQTSAATAHGSRRAPPARRRRPARTRRSSRGPAAARGVRDAWTRAIAKHQEARRG